MVALESLSQRLQFAVVNVHTILYLCAKFHNFPQVVLWLAIDSNVEAEEEQGEERLHLSKIF